MSEFARNLATVIGISDYQNGIDTLQTAVADAVAIAEILQNTYRLIVISINFYCGVALKV